MGVFKRVSKSFKKATRGIRRGIRSLTKGITKLASGLWDGVTHLVNGVWDSISSVAKAFGQAVADAVKYASKLTDSLCKVVKNILEKTWEFTKDAVEGIVVVADKILDAVTDFFQTFELKIWDGICLLGYLEKAIFSFQEKISSEINNMLECTNEYYTPVFLDNSSTILKTSSPFCIYYNLNNNSCLKGKVCSSSVGANCNLYSPNNSLYKNNNEQLSSSDILSEIESCGSVIGLFNKG